MSRILILGNTGDNIKTCYSWFIKTSYQGLTLLGHEVFGFDYRSHSIDEIRNMVLSIKPKIILTHTVLRGFKPIPQVLGMFESVKKKIGCRIVHTMQDARNYVEYPHKLAPAFDLALIGHTAGHSKMRQAWGIPTAFFPYSSLLYESMGSRVEGLSFKQPIFTGREGIHQDRKKFLKLLKSVIKIHVVETQGRGDTRNSTLNLSSSAECILGLCTGYDIRHFMDVRPWQYLGAGAFMIMRKFKGMDDLIPPNMYIPFGGYRPEDALFVRDSFEEWKNKDKRIIREKAFSFIQKYHNCKTRMENTLNVLGGKQETVKAFLSEI